MKKIILQPVTADEEVIVQFTEKTTVDKGLFVTVPNGYIAYAFIDEKPQFRLEPCEQKRMADYGKDILGHRCRIAFIRTKPLPAVKWGFGNVQVNNKRLKEAYRAGANGQCNTELVQPTKLIDYFADDEDITVKRLRERILPIIRSTGTAILGNFFAGTDISVFEISAHAAAFREKLFKSLKGETAFGGMGLELKDISANIYVNEEDVELIRSRINAPEKPKEPERDDEAKKLIEGLSERIERKFGELENSLGSRDDYAARRQSEIEELRRMIAEELPRQFGEKFKDVREAISEDLEERLQELLPLREQAHEEYIKNIKFSVEELIEHAEDGRELVPAAAMMYTDIEENLIKKFRLRFENKKFVMDYDDYLALADDAPELLSTYDVMNPQVVSRDKNGEPALVEMPPLVRFYEAGLSVPEARLAKKYWCFMNKLRHRSPDNEAQLKRMFSSFAEEKKYLSEALSFFRAHGFYTGK